MKINNKKLENAIVELTVAFDSEEWKATQEKALEENKCITILTECRNIVFKIKPTNNPEENCKLIYADGTPAPKNICALSHGWQPDADRLMSNDWIVVD